jgi:hypothetical protein
MTIYGVDTMGTTTCHFGFALDADLYHACAQTLKDVHQHPDLAWLNRCAGENLIRVTDTGFRAYYEEPVNNVKLSPMLRKTADAGVHTVQKAVHIVIRRIFDGRPRDQLIFMSRYMGDMLCTDPQGRHYLCFRLEEGLFNRATALLARVRTDANVDDYRQDILDALEQLIEAGLEAYYSLPVGQVNLGRFMRAASDLGINTAHKGIIAVVHKLFGPMSREDMLPLTTYFESLLHSDVTTFNQQQG